MRPRRRLSFFGKRLSALLIGALVALLLCGGLALAFTDVKPGDDYAEAIDELSSLGIISGFDDNTFRPNEPVTRQQFAKMIVKTLGLTVTGTEVVPFVDVAKGMDPGDPFYPDKYVAVCAANGITQGKTPTTFAPYANITRAQVMTMVVRAAPKAGVTLSQPGSAYYGDTRKIMRDFNDSDHGLNAQIAEANGLLWGIRLDSAGVWNPYKNATRGEVALMLWRLKQKMAPPVSSTTTTTQPPSVIPIEYDDFSDPDSGWDTVIWNDAGVKYSGGTYQFDLRSSGLSVASWWFDLYDDVYYEARAKPLYSSGSWEYGLVFRAQDMSNFYLLSVEGDGSAALWMRVGGQWAQMTQYVELPPIASDGWRHLEVVIVGDTVGAWVDDVYIGDFTDSTFAEGMLGFWVGTFSDSDFSVKFDDFTLWAIIY